MKDKNMQTLKDENWQKMSALLDIEMPVGQKKRRKFLVWWYSAAAIILSLGIYTFQIVNHKEGVNSKPTVAQVNIKEPISKPIEPAIFTKKSHLANKIDPNFYESLYGANHNLKKSTLAHDHLMKSNVNDDTSLLEISDLSDNINVDNISNGGEMIYPDVTDEKLSDMAILNPILEINPIPGITLKTINAHLVFPYLMAPANTLSFENKKGSWKLGVDINLLTHDYERIQTMSTGIFLEKQIHSKWNLTSGLRWKRVFYGSPYLSNNDVIVESTEKDVSEVNDLFNQSIKLELPEQQVDIIRQALIYDITESIDYVELSLGGDFRLSRRFSLSSAIVTGFKVKHKYNESVNSANNIIRNYSPEELTQNNIESFGNLNKSFILSFRLGTMFKMTNKLYLSTNAHLYSNNSVSSEELLPSFATSIKENSALSKTNKENRIGMEVGLKYFFITD